MKKCILALLSIVLMSFVLASDAAAYASSTVEEGGVVIDKSGTTFVNTKNIELGAADGCVMFEMNSTVMTAKGKQMEYTLNCAAIAAVNIKNGSVDVASDSMVTDVTIVNDGTITVHTRDLVEKYKDMIQTPANGGPRYKYLRVCAIYGLKNMTFINNGTINVYFDHDPNIGCWVYGIAFAPGQGSKIVNNGQIHFYGNGSPTTRMRGVATFQDDVQVVNNGNIEADVTMADDSRGITTGGNKNKVENNGTISLKVPGTICGMTRYGVTEVVNRGKIDLVHRSIPMGYTSVTSTPNNFACAVYESVLAVQTGQPPVENSGSITVTMEENENDDFTRRAYGLMFDLQKTEANSFKEYGTEGLGVMCNNTGIIKINNGTRHKYEMSEAFFQTRPAIDNMLCPIKVGAWRTTVRDFASCNDLFVANGVNMDFSSCQLMLDADGSYVSGTSVSVAPESLMYNVSNKGDAYKFTGYDKMTISVSNPSSSLNWDKKAKKVSIKN